jgi:hypothetical protein
LLINVSTRKLRRAVRLPEGDLPVIAGDGTSLAEWMASDLSKLDLLVIQIDGLYIGNDPVLVAALGIDGSRPALSKIRAPLVGAGKYGRRNCAAAQAASVQPVLPAVPSCLWDCLMQINMPGARFT